MLPESVTEALKHTWQVLGTQSFPAAVLGGAAVNIYSHIRMTQDVDFVLSVPLAQQRQVIDVLLAAGLRPRSTPARVVHLQGVDLVQFDFCLPDSFIEVGVDVQFAKSDYHQQLLERRVRRSFPGEEFEFDVVACEDLILLKLMAGRMIDLADAAFLLRYNAHEIDIAYLLKWGKKLSLGSDVAMIWDEAFPGLSPPNLPPKDEDSAKG